MTHLAAKPTCLRLLFVVPCYNEEEVLESTTRNLLGQIQLLASLGLCSEDHSGILFVDDGSRDATWSLIRRLSEGSTSVSGLSLSRNKGHMAALLAGLEAAVDHADVVISVDADLQDDISVCRDMLTFHHHGCDIVYGVRGDRSTDTFSKRFFANAFYGLMMSMGIEVVPGHGDFRLMSSRSLRELLRYRERSLFLRGIIPQLGYETAAVYYARKQRKAGSTKYPFTRSFSLALDGIASFSNKPLRLIGYMGIAMAFGSLIGLFVILVDHARGGTLPGWSSLMVVMVVIGGAQMLALGIIGEYLGRIYREVKDRPHYHVRESIGLDGGSQGSY